LNSTALRLLGHPFFDSTVTKVERLVILDWVGIVQSFHRVQILQRIHLGSSLEEHLFVFWSSNNLFIWDDIFFVLFEEELSNFLKEFLYRGTISCTGFIVEGTFDFFGFPLSLFLTYLSFILKIALVANKNQIRVLHF